MKKNILNYLKYLIIFSFCILSLYPFIWLMLSALKDQYEIYSNPFGFPRQWLVANLPTAWKMAKLSTGFFNSIIISTISVCLILLLSAMAAYSISRKMSPKWMYSYFSIGLMVGVHTIIIQLFSLYKRIGLLDTSLGLILIYSVSNFSLAIYILVSFFNTLPVSVEEAAMLDGTNRFEILFRIVLPMSKAGLSTVGVLVLLNCWNDYLYAFIFIRSLLKRTLTQNVLGLRGQYASNVSMLCAGLFISILPVILGYCFFQKQIIEGLTAGAVKE